MDRRVAATVIVLGTLVGVPFAPALINPNFTPVELVANADSIFVLRVHPANDDGKIHVDVSEVLKHPTEKPAPKSLRFHLRHALKDHIPAIRERILQEQNAPVLLFSGRGENEEPMGFLHIGGRWLEIEPTKNQADSWNILSMNARSGGSEGMGMEATWAGGTKELLALVRLLLAHPGLTVPVDGGASWQEHMRIAKIEGKIHQLMAVDFREEGQNALFVAAEKGDRMYAWDPKSRKFEEQTGKLRLDSRTCVGAWADFTGDGRLDLASWDGKNLTIWSQNATGVFAASGVSEPPTGDCSSLYALDVGINGKAGLVWLGSAGAVLLVPDAHKTNVWTKKVLSAEKTAADFATGGQACVADLDGDTWPDILQVGERGSVFYKGKGKGEFQSGQSCPIVAGSGPVVAFPGDWNADGRLDVFTHSEDCHRLWQNEGGGTFTDMTPMCGEMTYIAKSRGRAGNVCDINNDGRQDLFLAYSAETGPQIFFNRLFRSFGHAHQPLDIAELQAIPDVTDGQQGGVVADLTNDGAQDMAFALLTGEIYVFIRATDTVSCLAARVAVKSGGAHCGPVTVTAHNGIYPLGVWCVAPGIAEAFLGLSEAGELKIQWQLPGTSPVTLTKTVEENPIRILIPPTP